MCAGHGPQAPARAAACRAGRPLPYLTSGTVMELSAMLVDKMT